MIKSSLYTDRSSVLSHFVFALVQIHTVSVCYLKLACSFPKITSSCQEAPDNKNELLKRQFKLQAWQNFGRTSKTFNT